MCFPFTGGQGTDIPYDVTFEVWTTNRNASWYPHTIITTHYGFHEPGGSNDLVIGPVHTVDVLRQLSLDGNYPRMCYGVIDKYGLRCFFEYTNTRYYGTDDYTFKFISLAPLYQPDDNYGNPQPLDWKDWPKDKHQAAVAMLNDDDWLSNLAQSPQGGVLQPGDQLPQGYCSFPSNGNPQCNFDPITIPDGGNPNPIPTPTPSGLPEPTPSPSPTDGSGPPTASGGDSSPSPSPSGDPGGSQPSEPYVNNNPSATPDENKVGEFLDGIAIEVQVRTLNEQLDQLDLENLQYYLLTF